MNHSDLIFIILSHQSISIKIQESDREVYQSWICNIIRKGKIKWWLLGLDFMQWELAG